jgi:hypothetical protein
MNKQEMMEMMKAMLAEIKADNKNVLAKMDASQSGQEEMRKEIKSGQAK